MRSQRGVALLTGVAFLLVGCSGSTKASPDTTTQPTNLVSPQEIGVTTYEVIGNDHVEGTVTYPVYPPVGGDHAAKWITCGVYTVPVADEMAVHSLEHGAAWILYNADLSVEQIAQLAALKGPYVLISPAPVGKLDDAVVGSGWGLQKRFATFDLRGVTEFVKNYANGPQTPEKGASC